MRSQFDLAGVPPESLVCAYALTRTAAHTGFVEVVKAFQAAGREVQEIVASAYVLGGSGGVRAVVRELALPGVRINEFGAVCWVSYACDAGVGVEP
jgi:hypothetical protein